MQESGHRPVGIELEAFPGRTIGLSWLPPPSLLRRVAVILILL